MVHLKSLIHIFCRVWSLASFFTNWIFYKGVQFTRFNTFVIAFFGNLRFLDLYPVICDFGMFLFLPLSFQLWIKTLFLSVDLSTVFFLCFRDFVINQFNFNFLHSTSTFFLTLHAYHFPRLKFLRNTAHNKYMINGLFPK